MQEHASKQQAALQTSYCFPAQSRPARNPTAVTKILNGTSNFTLKTLLTIADALDLNLKIDFEEKEKASVICPVEDKLIIPLANGDEFKVSIGRGSDKSYSTTIEELDWAA